MAGRTDEEEKKIIQVDPEELDRLHGRCRQLRMWEILCRQSDMEHPIKKSDLMERMKTEHFSVNEHTFADDIKSLMVLEGHGIVDKRVGNDMTYYAENPQFDPMEMRILVDALLADSTLTKDELAAMLGKLFSHTGSGCTNKIMEDRPVHGSRAVTNGTMKKRLEILDEACRNERQVTFQYFYLDEHDLHVLQRNGKDYCVESAALIYRNDRYYLIGYDCGEKRMAHFRVDRMEDVPVIGRKNRKQKALTYEERKVLVTEAMNMFGGDRRRLILRLHDVRAIGILRDRFGDDVDIYVYDEKKNEWEAQVFAQESPELWGWLCGLSGLVTLTGSKDARKEYSAWLQNALNKVSTD